MALKTTTFEPEKLFKSAKVQAELLNDALSTGDAGYVADALGVIARARGISEIAKKAGVTRMALYKGLTKDGDPRLSTLLGVMKALGVNLVASPQRAR